jgi:hypothetical protein
MAKRRRRKYRNRPRENRCTVCGNFRDPDEVCVNPFCPMARASKPKPPA